MRILKKLSLVAGLIFISINSAMAATTTAIVQNFLDQSGGWSDVLSVVAYLIGIACGIKAVFKLKEHNETKGDVSILQPNIMLLFLGIFISMPTLMKNTPEKIYKNNYNLNTMGEGFLSIVK